LYARC
jgi:hypothetical protein